MSSNTAAENVSPKVSVPGVTLALSTIASAVISGDWSGSETALAIATVVTFALGYITPDRARA